MWSIGDVKAKGKAAFLGNYWKSVLAAIILNSLLAVNSSVTSNHSDSDEWVQQLLAGLTPEEVVALAKIVLVALGTMFIISLLLKIFLFNPLKVGCYRFFKRNIEEGKAPLGEIKTGFGGYGHTFITLFLSDLFLCLWTLLFIIPGCIKSYSYRMVPYILKDNPELSATEVITKSREMMNGHKWRTFLYDLSFIGWYLFGIVTFGLAMALFVAPYKHNADAALYIELSKKQ